MNESRNISTQVLSHARELVMRYGWNTMAYQILNPGISLWFSQQHEAVVGYVQTRTHCIVAGSPVAAKNDMEGVVLEFYQHISAQKKKVCFFGAQERIATILANHAPISSILLGAQPVWSPQGWLDTLHTKSSLRAQVQRANNKSVSAELWDPISVPKAELYRCLNEWIASRRLPPMHFLVEPDTLNRLEDRIVIIARRNGRVTGFCIASPIPLRNGWLIEQIVRGNDAPNGTAELLLETMVLHLRSLNAEIITLGLSPLSQQYSSSFEQPMWLKSLLQIIRYYGRSFYNFKGLDAFKSKFHPAEWEPVYAITNEIRPTPSTLYAIATAFSGMSPVRFFAKGVTKMITRKYSN
ncbi:MAG: DUF2156 domain-containing protein [Bacteroidota bacterium]